jgi:hypothetical protein
LATLALFWPGRPWTITSKLASGLASASAMSCCGTKALRFFAAAVAGNATIAAIEAATTASRIPRFAERGSSPRAPVPQRALLRSSCVLLTCACRISMPPPA